MTTTVWLTGLPSSGKTTLARALVERQRQWRPVQHLDGDVVRADLFPELGFTRHDRTENVRRIGRIATMLAGHGVLVVVSVIAPYRAARDAVRAAHEGDGLAFVEVHVDAPLEVCAARDVKGLYARARAGELTGLTGVDDAYEAPPTPELRLPTAQLAVAECVARIERHLGEQAAPVGVAAPGTGHR